AGCRISEKLDVLDALAQLVERGKPALEQGLAIGRRLDPLAAAIEQADAERTLQVSDRLRYDRVRDRQAFGGSRHAAGLNDGEQDIDVPQFEAATDAVLPLHVSLHRQTAI